MTDQGMESWDDERLAEIVRRGVRAIRAGVGCSGARVKVDGLWVLVSVERSSSQVEFVGRLTSGEERNAEEAPPGDG